MGKLESHMEKNEVTTVCSLYKMDQRTKYDIRHKKLHRKKSQVLRYGPWSQRRFYGFDPKHKGNKGKDKCMRLQKTKKPAQHKKWAMRQKGNQSNGKRYFKQQL